MQAASDRQYRGWRLTPDEVAAFDNKFAVGNEVVVDSYWSTSPTPSSGYVGSRNMVIETKSARDISDLAFGVNRHQYIGKEVYPSETIRPPGIKLHVTRYDPDTGTYYLEQIP